MSFSSILLGVVLILAIVALIVKTARRKRIANRNDAKTQYKVKSRIDSHRENQKRNAKTAKTAKKEIEEGNSHYLHDVEFKARLAMKEDVKKAIAVFAKKK